MGRHPRCNNVRNKSYLSYNIASNTSQLVFGQDAILNIQFEANWNLIRERKQRIIRKKNEAENVSFVESKTMVLLLYKEVLLLKQLTSDSLNLTKNRTMTTNSDCSNIYL